MSFSNFDGKTLLTVLTPSNDVKVEIALSDLQENNTYLLYMILSSLCVNSLGDVMVAKIIECSVTADGKPTIYLSPEETESISLYGTTCTLKNIDNTGFVAIESNDFSASKIGLKGVHAGWF